MSNEVFSQINEMLVLCFANRLVPTGIYLVVDTLFSVVLFQPQCTAHHY